MREHFQLFVKHRECHRLLLMLLNDERIITVCVVEQLYQFFFLFLIDIPLGFRGGNRYLRLISIHLMAMRKVHMLIVGGMMHGDPAAHLKVRGCRHLELRLLMLLIMVQIVLGITIKNWLLDTSDGSLRHAIKYLILLRRGSLEVFINQSVVVHRIDRRFLLRAKLIVLPVLLALILLAYCLSKRRKAVISERIKVCILKLLRLLRAYLVVVYFVYLIGNSVHLLIRLA